MRVATALAATVVMSTVIVQCNSKLDDPVGPTSENSLTDFAQGVDLPVLPETGYTFQGDTTDVLNFNISGNKLRINGKPYALDQIPDVIGEGIPTIGGHIVMRVDKDQSMAFVWRVEQQLRNADRRKVLYLARTQAGAKVESVLLLPPTLESARRNGIPTEPDISALEAEGKYDVLKIDLGNDRGVENQRVVYDFVRSHMKEQSPDYVVAARYGDQDTYGTYLLNLAYVKEGFHQLYQERAREMFGKDYFEVSKEEFNAVRQGIPMAISISERYKE